MKVLLDEDLPHKLRSALTDPTVTTVSYSGWHGLKNADLLRVAETSGIEVLITGDRSPHLEQNLTGRNIAVVSLLAQTWTILREHLPLIQNAVDGAQPGSFQSVDCGSYQPTPRRDPSP